MLYNSQKQIQEQDWTTQQFIRMSESLAQAFCPGMDKLTKEESASEQQNQEWDTQKLLELGKNLTAGFGGTITDF